MAFIPTPGVAQATINYLSNDNVVAVNRLYCATETVPTETDLEEIGDALYDVWVAQLMPHTSESWEITGIHVRAMNEAEGILFDDTNAYPIAGTTADVVPPASQVTCTTTLNTGLAGRSARGRVYMVGLPLSFQNGVRLLDTSRNALQSDWEDIQSAMETAGHALQVVSFFEGGVARSEGRALPVLSVNVRFPLATQRRRLS
jgi:hypothetical protein